MKDAIYNLDQLLDLIRWKKLQDQLALSTNMAIITVNYKGIPITEHSHCCSFCRSVRNNPHLESYCQVCDSRGGLEAVRSHGPFPYRCHFNIVDIAIPIILDDHYLGAIMAGQIKLENSSESDALEQMLSASKNPAAAEHLLAHQSEYDAIPTMSLKTVKQLTRMIFELSNYIVETALNKNQVIHAYETLYQNTKQPEGSMMSGQFLPVHRSDEANAYDTSLLAPALHYIDENRNEAITRAQMAELCHLSPSYFSHLFQQEMGQSFSHYLAKKKVFWARELLEHTDDSVETISEKLGFTSAAYFIKVFKRWEGLTPCSYRSYYRRVRLASDSPNA